ncbi:hypothetical protein F4813DRAFT_367818 [Daldinia decipiens]|uniref:uncharacterized protein n=1 Tax=Daldinia decipiens TaxID=326647 RepID=UPI0020C384CD|nr:uncharacterized protein F4813DRAFT_367818 [Daldinia decipiens]KAI1655414.1 hypothetical protein F4813DRAFT_367818 [Daldinia decipiens]
MASSLAQLGVQYMPSTGGCMLDLAAIPSHLFSSCGAIHIRIPEAQHHVEVNSNMVCIKPSQPAPGPGAAIYREQYMYPNVVVPTDLSHASPKNHKQQPPSFNAPETSVHHPVPEPDNSKPASANTPNDSHKDTVPSLQTFVKTAHWSTLTTTHTASPSPRPQLPPSTSPPRRHTPPIPRPGSGTRRQHPRRVLPRDVLQNRRHAHPSPRPARPRRVPQPPRPRRPGPDARPRARNRRASGVAAAAAAQRQ